MKKNFLLLVVIMFSVYTGFAQVSTTAEVPRNYKPKAKELLPMPGELTDEMIFPVLGQYEYTNKEGNVSNVTVSRDIQNKGMVWVNGLPQGKFKASLKASPATYKILAQKTLQNEVETIATDVAYDSAASAKPAKRMSGKSITEGTLIFDSTSNKLYVNIGKKYNEENPSEVFPEIGAADTTYVESADVDEAVKKPAKKKPTGNKGINYVLNKVAVTETELAPATAPADTTQTN